MVAAGCADRRPYLTSVSDSAGVRVVTAARLPAWNDEAYRWRLTLERELETAPGTTERPLIYQPQAMARLQDGTLAIVDNWELRLAVVDAQRDTVLARFGPRGRGPGEILSSNALIWSADGHTLHVFDPGNRRLSVFARDGELLEERPAHLPGGGGRAMLSPRSFVPYVWRVFRDTDTYELQDSVVRVSLDSERSVTVAPLPRPEVSRFGNRAPLMSGSVTFAPIGVGGVVVGRTDQPQLTYYTDGGQMRSIIRLPFERRPLSPGDQRAIGEEVRTFAPSLAENIGELGTLWSQLLSFGDSLFALEQRFTSAPAGEDPIPSDRRVWRVFSVNGSYRGALILPARVGAPYWIEKGAIVAVKRDSLGVATIVSYAIEEPPGVAQ